jgi:hypothetical protein
MNHALKILTSSKTDVGCTGLSELWCRVIWYLKCFIETFCLHLQVRRAVLLDVHGVTDQNTLTAVRRSRHLPGVVTRVGERQKTTQFSVCWTCLKQYHSKFHLPTDSWQDHAPKKAPQITKGILRIALHLCRGDYTELCMFARLAFIDVHRKFQFGLRARLSQR